ncbi:TonB-dependent receptor [Marinoscillum sp. MHG1-6]|uniref:SusC/RagA family TonB-linked outer membrane protein n=1 Tax=Marinoscillum sp. MHG1-6 TaxID=2959627 RepID=UPI002157C4D5|nr:TonB-dependent receptor [Marinoscillum sp. MHG1-6]
MMKPLHFMIRGKSLILVCLLMLGTALSWAQEKTRVEGQVLSSDGEPLPGVTILVKGTKGGTVTDLDGNFSISANPDDILITSFIGFTTVETEVNSQTSLQISMDPDLQELEEVVVVGYGTQKKSHLTGSVSKVTNETLDQIPSGRMDDALVGQISGVNIQQTNPSAGEAPTITVRGQGSISSSGSPLVVVDGIVVGSDYLGSVDMNDVESIELLKDAASSSIYGSRGANGVLMITTKKGKEGPTRFTYNGYTGFKSVPENDILKTVDEWADFVRANNNGELTDKMEYIMLLGTETDWQKVMMDGGMIQSHSISASGGTKNTRFRASVNYLDDEGVLLTDSYKKINFRMTVDSKLNKRVRFGATINPSYTSQRRFPLRVHDATRQQPWTPLYLDENTIRYVNPYYNNGQFADAQIGDYAWERMFDRYDLATGEPVASGGTTISSTSNNNPLSMVLERENWLYYTKVFGNTYLSAEIIDGLIVKTSVGGDFRYRRNTYWTGIEGTRNGPRDSRSRQATGEDVHVVNENTINYNRTFGNHEFAILGGITFEKWQGYDSDIDASGFDFDYIQTIPSANVTGASTSADEEALVSYLSRINYAYGGKYLASVSFRADGSSKFGPDRKYGFFPAFSAGWRISEEGFLQNNPIISTLKLRLSYGVSGSNSGIGRYAHIGLVEPIAAVLDGGLVSGFNVGNISNSELGWEKLVEYNPGLEFGVFDDRLYMSIDVYNRRSKDLLLYQEIPSITGFTEALVNLGVVENKGVEFELISRNLVSRRLKWNTSVILTHNKNTLVDFAGADGLISVVDDKRPAQWIAKEGHPISSFYGYVYKKDIPLEYIRDPLYPINSESKDVYVKDLNGDGIIDDDDRTILGSPYPDLIWSVTNTFRMGPVDLSFMFQGSLGAEVRNMDPQYYGNQFSSSSDYTGDFPDAAFVRERIFTNDIVMDASYVALRTFNIGYTLPGKFTNAAGIRSARFYASAQNLIYIMSNGYRGWNPEGINEGQAQPVTYGYQRGVPPIYRSVSLGLNLEF